MEKTIWISDKIHSSLVENYVKWLFVLDGEKNVKKESKANTFSAIFLDILHSYSFAP